MREAGRRIFLVLGSVIVAVLGGEIVSRAIFKWPELWVGRTPPGIERQFRRFHRTYLQGTPIQFRPDCSEPDSQLLYRLRPGVCRFATDEFDTEVRVSVRHLREDRLDRNPGLVFLGDSYTLGWGVAREAAFPALVGEGLRLREAVVANSSYGTVRELLLLRRLGLSGSAPVVLQYCTNDLEENRAYIRSGGYVPSPSGEYLRWVAVAARIERRWMFAHARHWFSFLWSDLSGLLAKPALTGQAPPTPADHADTLLRVLEAFADDLRGRQVFVFGADFAESEAGFVQAMNRPTLSPRRVSVRALTAAHVLRPEDRFRLDQHWRASGHARLAVTLQEALVEAGVGSAASGGTAGGRDLPRGEVRH